MLQVNIDQTFGRLEVNQNPAKVKIKTTPPNITVKKNPGAFKIDIDWPTVKIDNSASRSSMGYRNVVPFAKHTAQKGRIAVKAGILRTAREGDRLGKVEKGGSPIPQIAKASAWPEKQFNIGMMPSVPPDITSTGKIHVKGKSGDVEVYSRVRWPQVEVERSYVNVSVEVKPSINIEVSGQWIDLLG